MHKSCRLAHRKPFQLFLSSGVNVGAVPSEGRARPPPDVAIAGLLFQGQIEVLSGSLTSRYPESVKECFPLFPYFSEHLWRRRKVFSFSHWKCCQSSSPEKASRCERLAFVKLIVNECWGTRI